jgi:hypothetical protein
MLHLLKKLDQPKNLHGQTLTYIAPSSVKKKKKKKKSFITLTPDSERYGFHQELGAGSDKSYSPQVSSTSSISKERVIVHF